MNVPNAALCSIEICTKSSEVTVIKSFTHWSRVTFLRVGKLEHRWCKLWLIACSAPIHYLNQCWFVIYWMFGNTSRLNMSQNITIFTQALVSTCPCLWYLLARMSSNMHGCMQWFRLLSTFWCVSEYIYMYIFPMCYTAPLPDINKELSKQVFMFEYHYFWYYGVKICINIIIHLMWKTLD